MSENRLKMVQFLEFPFCEEKKVRYQGFDQGVWKWAKNGWDKRITIFRKKNARVVKFDPGVWK